MIHPSYVDLMRVVNKDVEEGETPVINSRYSIVMATAKRARQIVDGDEPLVKVSRGEKPLSIAVDELNQAEIRILAEDEEEEDYTDLLLQASEEYKGEDAEGSALSEEEDAEESALSEEEDAEGSALSEEEDAKGNALSEEEDAEGSALPEEEAERDSVEEPDLIEDSDDMEYEAFEDAAPGAAGSDPAEEDVLEITEEAEDGAQAGAADPAGDVAE